MGKVPKQPRKQNPKLENLFLYHSSLKSSWLSKRDTDEGQSR